MSDRELLVLLERVPQNFVIGKDDFGWWYSITGGSARFTGFRTMIEAVFHFARTAPDGINRLTESQNVV